MCSKEKGFGVDLDEGFKPVAWEGVGVRVPLAWDFVQHKGFWDKGMLKVLGPGREKVEVSWWRAGKSQGLETLAAGLWPDLEDGGVKWVVSLSGFEEVLGVRRPEGEQGVGFAVFVKGGERAGAVVISGCSEAQARRVAESLEIAAKDARRRFAFFEMSLEAPAGFELRESTLQAGVCSLKWTRGRQHLNFKRYSAANVTLGLNMSRGEGEKPMERLLAWARLAYAGEMRLDGTEGETHRDDGGRLVVDIRVKRRWFAGLAVTSLIPSHIKHPVWARVIWDVTANKLVCIDTTEKDSKVATHAVSAIETGLQFWGSGGEAGAEGLVWRRVRGVVSEVGVDGVVKIVRRVPRPAGIRMLRFLSGDRAENGAIEQKSALDGVGSWLWLRLDEQGRREAELAWELQEALGLSRREAGLSVGSYLAALKGRGLVECEG
jgi:hypothetical protein